MRDLIKSMVHDTEAEIFDYAAGHPDPKEYFFTDDDIEELDLAETEGWDGKPLLQDEIAYRSIYGDSDTGIDRPIALAEEEAEQSELARAQQTIADLQEARARDVVQFDPQIQASLQEQRENENYQVMNNPDAARQLLYRQQQENQMLQQHIAKQQETSVNANLAAYANEYGEDFRTAYSDLTSLNPNNPVHRSLVQEIYNADDPGAALMDWHANGGAQVHGRGRRGVDLPSLNSQMPGASRSARSSRAADPGEMSGWSTPGGWGGSEEEQSIFADAVSYRRR